MYLIKLLDISSNHFKIDNFSTTSNLTFLKFLVHFRFRKNFNFASQPSSSEPDVENGEIAMQRGCLNCSPFSDSVWWWRMLISTIRVNKDRESPFPNMMVALVLNETTGWSYPYRISQKFWIKEGTYYLQFENKIFPI